jgi:hypothetical protein
VDHNVIHIYREPALGHLFVKYHVYHHLECSGGVDKAKEYYSRFKEAFWCKKSSLPLISQFNSDIVVPPVDIKLDKKGVATKVVDGLGNQGGDIAVSLCSFIDGSVVLDWAKFSVLFLNKEEVGGIGAP